VVFDSQDLLDHHQLPVIAIDGPSASGKGSVAQLVAKHLGFHYLDSGALYRLVGLASLWQGIDLTDGIRLGAATSRLQIRFDTDLIYLDGQEVSAAIRTEEMGKRASAVGAQPLVRQALFTVIFPQARLKVFLTAHVEIRAQRRHKQLISKGISANIDVLTKDLVDRDGLDTSRQTAPLIKTADAFLLDTSEMGIEQAVQTILTWYTLAQ
jgi:cytidylate kinase